MVIDKYKSFISALASDYSQRDLDFFWKELDRYGMLTNLAKLNDSISRLKEFEPIQYITGQVYFYDCELFVNSDTLIPRPETEELVDLIIQDFNDSGSSSIEILDIGTGSGCIPVVLARHLTSARLTALEISGGALRTARRNAERYQLNIEFIESDIRDYDVAREFDIIVSNPPYIPVREKGLMHRNVLDYEPGLALFVPDEDPLVYYRLIADFAWQHLKIKGYLYFECNEFSAVDVLAYTKQIGFVNSSLIQDLQGKDRIVRVQKLR